MTEIEKELEKELEKQFGIGKAKVGLIICGVLVVILAISSLWLYTRIDGLQNQNHNRRTQEIQILVCLPWEESQKTLVLSN